MWAVGSSVGVLRGEVVVDGGVEAEEVGEVERGEKGDESSMSLLGDTALLLKGDRKPGLWLPSESFLLLGGRLCWKRQWVP